MNVEFISKTQSLVPDVTTADFTAYVARIGKVKDNPDKLIKYLIKHQHWSPFQHTYFGFKIRTSRAIGREILRHWSMDHQELSQRYEEILEFEPIELRKQAENNRQSSEEEIDPDLIWTQLEPYQDGYTSIEVDRKKSSEHIKDILLLIKEAYQMLLEVGVARECARFILPECTSTTMILTGNIRSWINFLNLRTDATSQKEIQIIANEIKKILAQEVPLIFA